jgi:hypothetical protein
MSWPDRVPGALEIPSAPIAASEKKRRKKRGYQAN